MSGEPLTREPYDNHTSEERLDIIEANEARNVRDPSNLTVMRFRRLFNEIADLSAQLAQANDMANEMTCEAVSLLMELMEIDRQLAQRTAELNNLRALKDYERVNLEAANKLLDERLQQLAALRADHQRVTLDWQQEKRRVLEALKAEKEVSDAYLRVRQLLNAYNTKDGGVDRFEVTETYINTLIARLAKAQQDKSSCETLYDDLSRMYAQAQATIAEQRAILEERRKQG